MSQVTPFAPQLRSDLLRRDLGHEAVVWSPARADPVALDPIATVMLGVVDGEGTIEDLSRDVADVVGIAPELAAFQVQRTIDQFDQAGLLVTSRADDRERPRGPFIHPTTSCMETSSCTGSVTPVFLEIAGYPMRVASTSRRLARKLARAVADCLTEGPAPLGFVVRSPRRHPRRFVILDRGGFVLGTVEGSGQALAVMLSYLSGFLPPVGTRVRVRARAVVGEDGAALCLWPLVFVPPLDESWLSHADLALLDRLAVDIDPATGRMVNGEVPWTSRPVAPPPGHVAAASTPIRVSRVIVAGPSRTAPPSAAEVAVAIANEATSGTRTDVLDAATELVRSATVHVADPAVTSSLAQVLRT
ncbi:MAG: hypothetical protein ACRDYW_07185 [Acidimicrobiales bacterium]